MKIVTVDEMRDIERRAADIGLPPNLLMDNAGLSIARKVSGWLGNAAQRQILVLVGPGNNGGDGLVAARHLHDWGARVRLYLCTDRSGDDPNYAKAIERGIPCVAASQDPDLSHLGDALASSDVVIDALFGTGKARPLDGVFKQALARVSEARHATQSLRLVAIDLPSGMDADTGSVDAACVPADLTVTLACPKLGLFSFPARDYVGELTIGSIGVPPHLAQNIKTELITDAGVGATLPERPRNAHKGTFGRVLVCSGSQQYIGAAYLACEGAMRVGAGLVTLAVARSLQPILASKLTETTYVPLPESDPGFIDSTAADVLHERLPGYGVLLMGCGLSQHPSVLDFVRKSVLEMPASVSPATVLDADALNTLAQTPGWWQRLSVNAILTPHPGEMSRLCDCTIGDSTAERVRIARQAASMWGKTVVLKGAHSIVASPDGEVRVSPIASAALASAGTGDVLAGAVAGLLAQGLSPFDAATCGVYVHGAAGEKAAQDQGDAGVVASDLLTRLPAVIRRLKEG
ncbi:MAG: NAD(P)H-hydrate dehydratase [Chloroflexota bacterium]|nr:NAD(P)H-hydrate dehydratase [Chloroflexota bacterium]